MVQTSNPDICSCGSQLFRAVWSVDVQSDAEGDVDPKAGNTIKKPVGFACEECGELQLTREIPMAHYENTGLALPDSADRDMVREE